MKCSFRALQGPDYNFANTGMAVDDTSLTDKTYRSPNTTDFLKIMINSRLKVSLSALSATIYDGVCIYTHTSGGRLICSAIDIMGRNRLSFIPKREVD